MNNNKIAIVIPSYKVAKHILSVVNSIPNEIDKIYVINDCCPENSTDQLSELLATQTSNRIIVLKHEKNQGVGGAVITGYQQAIKDNIDIVVKIDGDGQMDLKNLPALIHPIIMQEADYTKGNRFYNLEKISCMPKIRLFGNAALSFMTKLSTGYWNSFDPTNGYTAISLKVLKDLPFDKISKRYFFESDMLFRLNTIRACVVDVPMDAKYEDEVSNLKISKVIGEFFWKHCKNFFKRIFYNYYLRDVSIASIELPLGLALVTFGSIFGAYHWIQSLKIGAITPAGTVIIAALPIIIGIQLILAFINYDITNVPKNSRK